MLRDYLPSSMLFYLNGLKHDTDEDPISTKQQNQNEQEEINDQLLETLVKEAKYVREFVKKNNKLKRSKKFIDREITRILISHMIMKVRMLLRL